MTKDSATFVRETVLAGDTMELVRVCVFRPYRKGCGPAFRLRMWDTGKLESRGALGFSPVIAYALHYAGDSEPIFCGQDFRPGPCVAIDSNEAVEGLMSFLCLREGDTDYYYFANYTSKQLAFRDTHAESLSCEVMNRFCDENGNVR